MRGAGIAIVHACMAIVGFGLAYSPEAEAVFGQCRWEGGSGAAGGHAYCKAEDCIGKGGIAQCTIPVAGPPNLLTRAELGPDSWLYATCDDAGPNIGHIRLWCEAGGGAFNNSTFECSGLPAGYVRNHSSQMNNEPLAITASDAFIQRKYSPSCTVTGVSDTGWGASFGPVNCGAGGTVFDSGVLVQERRRRTYQLGGQCSGSSFAIHIDKYRAVECPPTYLLRTSAGVKQCFKPAEAACPVANPVSPVTGAKLQTEVDYRSAGSLEFVRHYNSSGYYRPSGLSVMSPGPIGVVLPNDFWRHTYDRRLYVVTGNPEVIAVAQDPDGSLHSFGQAGREQENINGAGASVVALPGVGWRLTRADRSVEDYDTNGRLISITSSTAQVTTLNYQSTGLLGSVVGPFGTALQFSYDAAGRLSTTTLPDTTVVQYGYDAFGSLTSVTYPDSTIKRYHYEDTRNPWLLTGITDESNQRYATYEYDNLGRVSTSRHAAGADRHVFTYSSSPLRTNVQDPTGLTRTYRLAIPDGVTKIASSTAPGGACGTTQAYAHDAVGNVSARVDYRQNRTEYSYDLTRNLETSRTEAFGTSRARTIGTQWHPTYRLPTQIDEPGRRTTFAHDANGNVEIKTVTDTVTGTSRTGSYDYNSFGQVLTADGPRTDVSDVTTYTYYSCTTGYQCGQVATITNAAGHITTFNTYNAHGQPLTITDPNGVIATLTYDLRQRLTSRTVGGEQTVFEYWPTGLLKKVTLPDSSFLQYAYDAAHRLTGISDSEGNHVTYTLDAMGNRTAEEVFDPSNALTRTRTRMFNTLNQLWKELGAAGTTAVTTTFGYDNNGNQTTINAPLSRNTTQSYDELNRLTQVTGPLSTVAQYGYNALDQLISVTDPGNLQTTYQYNALGDLLAQASPDTGTTTLTYDAAGNTATKTDARGASIGQGIYAYDALNRITQIQYPDQTLTYSYDTCLNGIGRLCGMTAAGNSTSYEYDLQGRVTRKVQTLMSSPTQTKTREVRYSYTNGRLTQLQMPSGVRVVYGYDTVGRIASMGWALLPGDPPMPLLSDVLYDPFGGVRGWTWADGTLEIREYDPDGRVSVTEGMGGTQYDYDDAGRLTHTTSLPGNASRSWTYDYDLLDRLTDAASTGETQSFDYDANGNRLAQGGTQSSAYAYTSPLSSNRLQGVTGALNRTYSYDAAGNITGDGLHTYGYDGAGRLASVSSGNTIYRYNGLGQRMLKRSSGVYSHYLYDEAGHLLENCLVRPSGPPCNEFYTQHYIWLGDIPVATLLNHTTMDEEGYLSGWSTRLFNVHTDHLHTPVRLSNAVFDLGHLGWQWDRDPFGNGVPDGNPENDPYFVEHEFDLRFPGQLFSAESGLNYNYFRDCYDPATGRYCQSDPIGLEGGLNTYAYVKSNPLSLTDPSGLDSRAEPRPCVFLCWPFGDPHTRPPGGWLEEDWLQDLLRPIMETAPGNVADTQIKEDYEKYASAERLCGKTPKDRCTWLEENKSRYRADQVKATQKAWGCRRSRALR